MYPTDIRKYKIELRQARKTYRRTLDPVEKQHMDAQIAARVQRLYQYRFAKVIMVYVSTPIEVDTRRIIANAFADGKQVAVPRCIPETRKMEFHFIQSLEQLQPGNFGVLEPPESFEIVTDFSKALMLVPGFIFDVYGYRLGYGKGYYDRYMSRYGGAAVGLCYNGELRRRMLHGRFDRTVDTVVTDKCIRRCVKGGERRCGGKK